MIILEQVPSSHQNKSVIPSIQRKQISDLTLRKSVTPEKMLHLLTKTTNGSTLLTR